MTAIILQSRLDSSRLPGKALLALAGEPLVYRVMQALKAVKPAGGLCVLACPEDSCAAFAPFARRAGFELFAGDKYNVLARYAAAARAFGADRIIRATGDNPFVFADAAAAIQDEAAKLGADYAAYAGLPYGAGVEAVSAAALFRAEKEAAGDELEHVCPYIYGRGSAGFSLHRPLAPATWRAPQYRLTIDTPEDFKRAQMLYDALTARYGESSECNSVERYSGEAINKVYPEVIHERG